MEKTKDEDDEGELVDKNLSDVAMETVLHSNHDTISDTRELLKVLEGTEDTFSLESVIPCDLVPSKSNWVCHGHNLFLSASQNELKHERVRGKGKETLQSSGCSRAYCW